MYYKKRYLYLYCMYFIYTIYKNTVKNCENYKELLKKYKDTSKQFLK